MQIKIKKLTQTATTPSSGSYYAAGYDLYSDAQAVVSIPAHSTVKVGTGIALEIPEGYFGALFARSGIATDRGLRPANCVGVIDSDYRGEIKVALHNDTEEVHKIDINERIAQIVFLPYMAAEFLEVDELTPTDRAGGGFGSTDINNHAA